MTVGQERTMLAASATPWSHRPHLDGLRTVAVYAVVLFHAELALVAGGFVGVDLFFVLSGYLVTNVLLSEFANEGTVRLTRFYARRARRLIPAATFVIIGTAVGALMVLPALDRARLVGDARASSLWYANWHFLGQESQYFAIDGPESPYLHFWSLAIEEQFYLAFPLLLVGLWKIRSGLGLITAGLLGLIASSLLIQLLVGAEDINRAYLGTDARIYQILAGALLATVFWRWNFVALAKRSSFVLRLLSFASFASFAGFVFVASSAFDGTVLQRGLAATVVSIAALVTLEVGRPSLATRALSWRPVRYLGQISYGTYLWHWPVLVLSRSVVDMTPIAAALVSGVLGTAMAALSASLVESPVRKASTLDVWPRRVIAAGLMTAAVSGVVVAPALLDWDRRPVVVPVRANSAVGRSGPVPDLDWEEIARKTPGVPPCEDPSGSDCYVVRGDRGTILMIGDSHARMLLPAVEAVALRRGMSLAIDFSHSCPWQEGLLAGEPGDRFSRRCAAQRPVTYASRIDAIDPSLIILAGYPRSEEFSQLFTETKELSELSQNELVAVATEGSLRRLAEAGRPVLVVEPVPVLPRNPLSCLSGAADRNECGFAAIPEGVEEQIERDLASELSNVLTLDLDSASCSSGEVCAPIIDDIVVRRDRHHFTPEFAQTLVSKFAAAVEQLIDDG
jgi:peptidoglycan/LPS O-acetylase OafA/YrhL